jgi:acyl carrier protein
MNEQQALEWITGLFGEKPGVIQPETLRDNVPNWDSMGVITLMAELDERFGILLEDKDLQAMKRVGDILDVLKQNGKMIS